MNIRYDDNLDSYKEFFDQIWADNLFERVKNSFLEEFVFDLCASWKGVSKARYLPWLLIEISISVLSGYSQVKYPTPLKVIDELIEAIANNLEHNKTTLIHHDKQALIKEFKRIQEKIITEDIKIPNMFSKESLWNSLVDRPEFALSLWMSEINVYTGVYFAYEIFLINCLKHKYQLNSLRINKKEFLEKLELFVGEDLKNKCWKDNYIEKARLIRHAVTHNGRKITNDLEKYRNELLLECNEIVIFPHDTNNLFDELKNRVDIFCDKILSNE